MAASKAGQDVYFDAVYPIFGTNHQRIILVKTGRYAVDRAVILTYTREEACTVPVWALDRLKTNRPVGLNLDLLQREDSQLDIISIE